MVHGSNIMNTSKIIDFCAINHFNIIYKSKHSPKKLNINEISQTVFHNRKHVKNY